MGTHLPRKRGTARPRNFLTVYIVAGCNQRPQKRITYIACQYEPEEQNFIFPAIFGRHLEYLELPKGDMTTHNLGFLLRSYTTIIYPGKNYIRENGKKTDAQKKINFRSLTNSYKLRAIFQTLANVQSGEAIRLQRCIDINAVRFENPELTCLQAGTLNELKSSG